MAVISAIAAVVGAAAGVGSMLLSKPPKPPTPQIPAAAASGPREDTGATVKIGTSEIKDQRVSGARKKTSSSGVDVLGGLGKGGVSL